MWAARIPWLHASDGPDEAGAAEELAGGAEEVERVDVVEAAATARGVEDVVVARPRARRSDAVLPAVCGAAQTKVKERKRGRRARKACVGSMSAVGM